jgi:hypothetical protein
MPTPAAYRYRSDTTVSRQRHMHVDAGQPRHGASWLGRIRVVGVGVAVTFIVAACSDSSAPGPGAASPTPSTAGTSSPVATGTPSPTAAADQAAVEAAYKAFWPVVATFDRRYPPAQWRSVLGRVAVDPQLSQAVAVATQQRRIGVAVYGQPSPRAPRAALGPAGRATVSDCIDFSHYGQADAKTGQPKTVGKARTPIRVTLAKGRDGTWRVADVTFPKGGC